MTQNGLNEPSIGARTREQDGHRGGVWTGKLDVCSGSTSSLLEEGAKIDFHPYFRFRPPSDTFARKTTLGEGAASEWRVMDLWPERWKPPDVPSRTCQRPEEIRGVASSFGRPTYPP